MKLADYLEQNNLTAAAFAEKIGVARSTVGLWLRPRRGTVWRPNWEHLKKIKDVTGGAVTADDFVDPPDEEEPRAVA